MKRVWFQIPLNSKFAKIKHIKNKVRTVYGTKRVFQTKFKQMTMSKVVQK